MNDISGISEMKKKIFMVLDIGTSYIKCAMIDDAQNIIIHSQCAFPMEHKQQRIEVDFELFFKLALDLIKNCLNDSKTENYYIQAILITSQAQTFAAVDENFVPLYQGIVWLDERADKEAEFLKVKFPDFAQSAGFKEPLAALYVSKLLWLKHNKPAVFNKAAAFPLINEYLFYKLSGKFYSDSTTFGMSGMYDFRQNSINRDLLDVFELSEEHFPLIKNAGTHGELITGDIKQMLGLDYHFPVVLCGNDQGASACGAGLQEKGDMNINFGTAMVFYTLSDNLISNLSDYQIAGKHPQNDKFFLLNFESDSGVQIQRIKKQYFSEQSYDNLFECYLRYPDVNTQQPILDSSEYPVFTSPSDAAKFCSGIIKYYLQRLNVHYRQIKKSVKLNKITVSGGFTQSEIWLNILKKVLDLPFEVNNRQDAGLLGAVKIYKQN